MNYVNYHTAIVEKHRAKLFGWPLDKFAPPSEINTVGELRKLRAALASGETYWRRLTPREVTAHMDKVQELQEGGQVIGRKRKTRSDKGTKRTKVPATEGSRGGERGTARARGRGEGRGRGKGRGRGGRGGRGGLGSGGGRGGGGGDGSDSSDSDGGSSRRSSPSPSPSRSRSRSHSHSCSSSDGDGAGTLATQMPARKKARTQKSAVQPLSTSGPKAIAAAKRRALVAALPAYKSNEFIDDST